VTSENRRFVNIVCLGSTPRDPNKAPRRDITGHRQRPRAPLGVDPAHVATPQPEAPVVGVRRIPVGDVQQLLGAAFVPLGALVAGTLADRIGIRPTLWIAAAIHPLMLMAVLASPIPRLRELPAADEEEMAPPAP
jgi:hypothetical protein